LDFPGVKRINWGYQKINAEGTGPVEDVSSPDIACRQSPLVPPALNAVARAGSKITFKWTEWFGNHKGPVLTYMGLLLNESTKVQDVEFFKIDEATYNPATEVWGTDQLIKDNSTRTVTIPSNIKPGMYVVRHEIISLHFAFRENNNKKTSGAQFYPTCFKVQVLSTGTTIPSGMKFPGAYRWNEKGILDNIYYSENNYVSCP
jgi:cellulase